MFIILAGTCKASSEAGADRLCACHVMGAGQGGGGGGGGGWAASDSKSGNC